MPSPDTYDADPDILPPVTKSLRQCWPDKFSPLGNKAYVEPVPDSLAMRGILDAVHALELRVAELEES